MTSPCELFFSNLLNRVYQNAYAVHGELDLDPQHFAERLRFLIKVHLGSDVSLASNLDCLRSLYAIDLYLSIACAQSSDAAWRRFLTLYEHHILECARFNLINRGAARELADSVIPDLCLPDASGKSRIASYDGSWPLITWLRAVVSHQAINQHKLRRNGFESMDSMRDVRDDKAVSRIDAALIANRYSAAIKDSFAVASASLTEHERHILLLRYDDALQVTEIATTLAVHPSTVTRQIQQAQAKLQKRIIRTLALEHHFGPAVIKECLTDILENPSHSLLASLKAC